LRHFAETLAKTVDLQLAWQVLFQLQQDWVRNYSHRSQPKLKMKIQLLALAVLPIILSSCATPPPPQAFHNADNSAFVVKSLDEKNCQLILPVASAPEPNNQALSVASKLSQHQTAVVVLENYDEPKLGNQFEIRSTDWFVSLRGLGYQHIVFVRGNNSPNPDGLLTLAEYN
jgi:hypothetical protein